jgi:hypothetical protein
MSRSEHKVNNAIAQAALSHQPSTYRTAGRGNPRTHSRKQVRQIAESIRRFGFTNPVLVGEDGEIIAVYGRVEAAKLIGLEQVPTVRMLPEKRPQRTHACRTARDRGAFARDRVR